MSVEHYVGWIPNVSGRLSFSVFGKTAHPTRAISANVSDGNRRFVVCYQQRNLLDVALPFKSITAPLFFGYRGVFRIVCISTAGDRPEAADCAMTGNLLLFQDGKDWATRIAPALHRVQNHLRDFERLQRKLTLTLADHCGTEFEQLRSLLTNEAIFYVDVNLKRSGDTRLSLPGKPLMTANSPDLPSDETAKRQTLHEVVSQLFFFLKDIGHVHQHHDAHTDTIVDLYEQCDDDDYSWRCSTLRCLYRKVIEYKRVRQLGVYGKSLGVLAYAKSFEKSSNLALQENTQTDELKVEPRLYQDYIVESVRANQGQLNREIEIKHRSSEVYRNTVISILTLLIAMLGLLQLSKVELNRPAPVLEATANFVLTQPHYVIFLLIAAFFVIRHAAELTDLPNSWVYRRSMRFLLVFGKKKAVAAALVSAVLVMSGSIAFFAPDELKASIRNAVAPIFGTDKGEDPQE